ncbi:MAG: hypothetical protein GOMPHAMPRED_003282 [Gomphillus americanus]|uniref:alpha-1,2-Mannosidase n=1 Tax=Gomphillus americanus TaxID=1940652 RepID=A0A8H3I5K9_9LECA|nr:MAG: hypothetical protein GOMPHAMPRED_003282 [Gomphillus americanus]
MASLSKILLLSTFSCATFIPSSQAVSGRAAEVRDDPAPVSDRAAAVKEAFEHAWNGYYTYAFPDDELRSVSNVGINTRNGWGATAVDALSTAIVMEETDIVQEILNHIYQIDYTQTDTTCSLFETTIRYIGGMLSGYDLLTGPYSYLGFNQSDAFPLLNQSMVLADTLSFAFNTPTGIPYNNLNITAQTSPDDPVNGLATIGTLILEWQRLSDLTGDPKYGDYVAKGESYLLNPSPPSGEPFPGLLGQDVSINTGEIIDTFGGWIGGDDSFYEYLLKAYVYDSSRFSNYLDRWLLAADSSIQHLASTPPTGPQNLTYLAEFNNTTLILESQHLACFDGGSYILGGLVLKNQTFTDFGLDLVAGCRNTYTSTATHIMPDSFGWDPNNVPADQASFYAANGFYYTNAGYYLRPEYLESVYYAYRATSNTTYQDWAWEAFVAINSTTRTPTGFSEISNVTDPTGGDKLDVQDSFFLAEVLKYLYLIFDDAAPVGVAADGVETWVFNTEAQYVFLFPFLLFSLGLCFLITLTLIDGADADLFDSPLKVVTPQNCTTAN